MTAIWGSIIPKTICSSGLLSCVLAAKTVRTIVNAMVRRTRLKTKPSPSFWDVRMSIDLSIAHGKAMTIRLLEVYVWLLLLLKVFLRIKSPTTFGIHHNHRRLSLLDLDK